MATEREFEGKDLQEVLEAASASMGIAEPDLDYEIVEQGRRGLFGVGAKSMRIRVMPPIGGMPEAGTRKTPRAPKKAAPEGEVESVQATVQKMLDLMGLELTAHGEAADAGVSVQLDGPDRKLLVQKDRQLISALQFLLNRMARRTWPETGRIHLCCEGRSRQRDDELVELTREVAGQVLGTGQTRRLHPMNAYERRLVHITVREFEELGSRSEGNGHLKRVRLFKRGG